MPRRLGRFILRPAGAVMEQLEDLGSPISAFPRERCEVGDGYITVTRYDPRYSHVALRPRDESMCRYNRNAPSEIMSRRSIRRYILLDLD
jgi:hypothetical protein